LLRHLPAELETLKLDAALPPIAAAVVSEIVDAVLDGFMHIRVALMQAVGIL
jgi:hypothetical protein